MKIDKKFRKLMISNPGIVRNAVLTDLQIDLYKFVAKEGIATSRDAADRFGWSVQQAVGTLNKLYQKGYLSRLRVTSPTGGDMYEYRDALGG